MRGHIKRIAASKYRIVFDAPRGLDGKRKLKTETILGNAKKAQAILAQRIAAIHNGEFVDSGSISVSELLERFLETSKAKVSATTFQRYSGIITAHLKPVLGSIKLSQLSPLHLEQAYSRWLESGRADGKGGLSAQTVWHHHRLVHKILNQAVKWKMVFHNVAAAVDPPKPRHREMQALTEAELLQLLKHAENPSDHATAQMGLSSEYAFFACLVFLAFVGCRRGECLALRWNDVNLSTGTAIIRRSLEETKDGLAFKSPKNGRSRSVELPQYAIEVMRRLKAKQNAQRLAFGQSYRNDSLVFARPDGSPIRPQTLGQAFNAVVERAKIARISLHGLRHTHASLMAKAGAGLKVISQRLGHSTTSITGDLYSHVLPGMDREAADRFDSLLQNAKTASGEGPC